MKKSHSSGPITAKLLSLAAIVVLLGFVAWWLAQTFTDEKRRHRRELELVLRETYMQTQFARFWTDSAYRSRVGSNMRMPRSGESTMVMGRPLFDSSKSTRPGDTTASVTINPPANFMRMRFNEGDDYVDSLMGDGIQVSVFVAPWDTLHLDTVRLALKAALEQASLPANFELMRVRLPRRNMDSSASRHQSSDTNAQQTTTVIIRAKDVNITNASGSSISFSTNNNADSLNTERQPGFFRNGNNNERLVASFPMPYALLLAKMKWQILFSLMMIALVGLALFYNYRNMLVQARLVKAKNDLISNITHELKTPIATVGVALEAMQNFNALQNPERTKEYLSISQQELRRLNLLVDKVLNLSMFDADKMQVQISKVDMLHIAKQVAGSLQLQLEKVGGDISWHANAATHVVMADEQHLISILFNLLDNAIKYRSEKMPLHIDIHFTTNAGMLLCTIADNGIGIASEERKRVFEKFYRVQNGDTHDVKGYGLGLSYVYEAIAAMHGQIHVEETAGGGASFVLALPLA